MIFFHFGKLHLCQHIGSVVLSVDNALLQGRVNLGEGHGRGDGTQSFKGIDVDGAGLDADLLTSNIGGSADGVLGIGVTAGFARGESNQGDTIAVHDLICFGGHLWISGHINEFINIAEEEGQAEGIEVRQHGGDLIAADHGHLQRSVGQTIQHDDGVTQLRLRIHFNENRTAGGFLDFVCHGLSGDLQRGRGRPHMPQFQGNGVFCGGIVGLLGGCTGFTGISGGVGAASAGGKSQNQCQRETK